MTRHETGSDYFGQPVAGFFFASDFFISSPQLPSNLSWSGLGPGLGLAEVFMGRLFAMLGLYQIESILLQNRSDLNIVRSLRWWRKWKTQGVWNS